jgi:hypothetical protein
MVDTMKKDLFSSKKIRALAAIGAVAAVSALPVASASASTGLLGSSTLFATLQGTSILGQEIPVLGTQGWYITLPVNSAVVPQFVWNALDFTVSSTVKVGNTEIVNLYVDPHMSR